MSGDPDVTVARHWGRIKPLRQIIGLFLVALKHWAIKRLEM